MAITTYEDIQNIQKIILADEYLQSLGFNIDTVLLAPATESELKGDTLFMFIFPSLEQGKHGEISRLVYYDIEVVGVRTNIWDVSNAVNQVQALLEDTDIGNNHILNVDIPPTQMKTPKEIIMLRTRYKTYATVYNEVKKVQIPETEETLE